MKSIFILLLIMMPSMTLAAESFDCTVERSTIERLKLITERGDEYRMKLFRICDSQSQALWREVAEMESKGIKEGLRSKKQKAGRANLYSMFFFSKNFGSALEELPREEARLKKERAWQEQLNREYEQSKRKGSAIR
ncbi:MAG TPA: hypothetical protein VM432_04195 [Bdellovibrionales bacterium]|nr:hypothetical protein [Bdellovibrionales bacterium]